MSIGIEELQKHLDILKDRIKERAMTAKVKGRTVALKVSTYKKATKCDNVLLIEDEAPSLFRIELTCDLTVGEDLPRHDEFHARAMHFHAFPNGLKIWWQR